jgi:hypothetical protein
VLLHPHHDRWIPNPLNEHMNLKQALLHAQQFQLRLLSQRTSNFVDVSIEMIMGLFLVVTERDMVMVAELVLLWIKWVSIQGRVIKIKHH